MTREEIVIEARKWMFVRHTPRGRTRAGLDCLGLGIVVAHHFNVPHEDMPDYSEQPHPRRLILTVMHRWLKPMPIDGDLTGCFGVFAQITLPCHIGIFSWKDHRRHVIHVKKDCGVAEEAYDHDARRKQMRVIDVLAFPGMEV